MKNATIGGSVGWEEIERDDREALRTDEYTGKVYSDVRVDDFGMFRFSWAHSERRYDRYDEAAWYSTLYPTDNGATTANEIGAGVNDLAMVKLDLANRDRDKAMALFAFDNIPYIPNLTITPNAGLRFDHYLTDTSVALLAPGGQYLYQAGLQRDNQWNLGIEAAYAFRPGANIILAYVREGNNKQLVGSDSSSNSVTGLAGAIGSAQSRFLSNMVEDVDTFIVGTNVTLSETWNFSASYSIAFAKENWTEGTIGPVDNNCTGSANITDGVTNPAGVDCQPFPKVITNSQRLDAVLKHKLDPDLVSKAGFSGDVFWNLKASWDHLNIQNWQNDLATPYMYLVDASNNGKYFSMAELNPNYDVVAVTSSINFRW